MSEYFEADYSPAATRARKSRENALLKEQVDNAGEQELVIRKYERAFREIAKILDDVMK